MNFALGVKASRVLAMNKFSQFPLHITFLVNTKAMNIDNICQIPNLLTLDEWKQLNKETSNNLFVDLSNKLHRKDLSFEQVLTEIKTKIDAPPCLGGEQDNKCEKQSASPPPMVLVRSRNRPEISKKMISRLCKRTVFWVVA